MIYLYNIFRYIEKIPDCTHMDISVFTGDVVHGHCNIAMVFGLPKYKAVNVFEMNIPIFSVHVNLKNINDDYLTYLYADQKNVFSDGKDITKEIEEIFDHDD